MSFDNADTGSQPTFKELQKQISKFVVPSLRRSTIQIVNTFLPYVALWVMMVYSINHGYPYWVTFLLVIPSSALLIRLFIIFHDCCHTSFFASQRANQVLGFLFGVLTLTPYDEWGTAHLTHHSTVADLERRGVGDVWTMTVQEYRNSGKWTQLAYRLVRNPFVMFGLGPIWVFFIKNRFSHKGASRRERVSVLITNLTLLGILVLTYFTIGLKTYLVIQVSVQYFAGIFGIWLFYVQHQFDPTHWYPHENWDYLTASIYSSSYYKLPKILQWISGNIGLHHVHHINPRIPNYHLQACLDSTPFLQQVVPLTIGRSLSTINMNLWDEEQDKLVSFRSLRKSS
jgi:omega-6 fatty acid desaturase (delta-12 desaturase)